MEGGWAGVKVGVVSDEGEIDVIEEEIDEVRWNDVRLKGERRCRWFDAGILWVYCWDWVRFRLRLRLSI